MKRICATVLVLVMLFLCGTGFAVEESGSMDFRMETIEGQKVIFADSIETVTDFLFSLSRQTWLYLATVDKGNGKYYARIKQGQGILTFENGTKVSAYEVTKDEESLTVLADKYLLIENALGEVYIKENMDELSPVDDSFYPIDAYDPETECIREEYTLAVSYPLLIAEDTLSTEEGFNNQELFKALVVGYDWFGESEELGYFIAWNVFATPEPEPEPDPTPNEQTAEPTQKPTVKPTPAPTAEPTIEPTVEPTIEPTVEPTTEPTVEPTIEPTVEPTTEPTLEPTTEPTIEPTVEPTSEPTVEPTTEPTTEPTVEPTSEPTSEPENNPPSGEPTSSPSGGESDNPPPSESNYPPVNNPEVTE